MGYWLTFSSISFQLSAELSDKTKCDFGSLPAVLDTSPKDCNRASVLETSWSGSAFPTLREDDPNPFEDLAGQVQVVVYTYIDEEIAEDKSETKQS